MSPRAFVTLHDVAPGVLDSCLATLDALRDRGVVAVTLLVVPGLDWSDADLDVLRRLQRAGHPLAGHGWVHRAGDRRTLYHRLHGLVISRDEAEHLSRSTAELRALVSRCHAWFADVGLGSPDFYVPPAWAMGRLSRDDLDALPFRYYETQTGIYDSERRVFRRLPVVGYLADTRTRAVALRLSNAFNRAVARVLRRPLRVSIHPPDLDLHLADRLLALVERPWRLVDAQSAVAPTAQTPTPEPRATLEP